MFPGKLGDTMVPNGNRSRNMKLDIVSNSKPEVSGKVGVSALWD